LLGRRSFDGGLALAGQGQLALAPKSLFLLLFLALELFVSFRALVSPVAFSQWLSPSFEL
jgi:hypothetical protein